METSTTQTGIQKLQALVGAGDVVLDDLLYVFVDQALAEGYGAQLLRRMVGTKARDLIHSIGNYVGKEQKS